MAPVAQEPEISLAQRLASNDKPVRTKALKTLRKYINVRSQKVQGGFSSEDLLKIWKGLFYCLWMQDKPLLQEELSHRISGLIHSFHTSDNQLLYFTTFLQTVKREWNGIDRLRMDKFFQLVRFMFRQTLEALKRKGWESRVVNQFLQIFTEQLLRSTEDVPKGLILHVLDLYMTELALVGSAELTAEQNLTFVEPFCKTMAKTKDRFLLASVSKNVFMTIVDQAPYAIEDLMRELQRGGGEDSDSGQASGEEEEEEEELKNKAPKKTKVKKFNGISEDMENSDGSKDDLDSVGSEENDPIGPVLQFDYGAIADRLFELGSHLNTRNINRTKMYRLVKTFRDLSEGVFPQNEEKRNVRDSSDDDDDVFNKRKKKSKKKKRKNTRPTAGDETAAKKSKACEDEQKPSDSLQDSTENPKKTENKNKASVELTDREKPIEPSHAQPEAGESDSQSRLEDCATVKKKRKNKKLKTNSQDVEEEKTDGQIVAKPKEQISLPGQLETTEPEADRRTMVRKKKWKSKNLCSSLEEVGEEAAVRSLPKEHHAGGEIGQLSTPRKIQKVKRKTLKFCSQEAEVVIKSPAILEDADKHNKDDQEISRHPCPTSEEDGVTKSSLKASTTSKKPPRKGKKLMSSSQEVDSASQDSCAEGIVTDKVTSAEAQPCEALTVRTKKIKKKKKETGSKLQVDLDAREPEVSSKSAHSTANESKGDTAEGSQLKSVKKAKKKKQAPSTDEEPMLEAGKQPAVEAVSTEQMHTPCKKTKIQKKQEGQAAEEAKEPEVGTEARDAALSVDICATRIKSLTPMKKGKKKRKLQAETSLSNGHAEEEMGGKKFKNRDPEVSTSVTPKKLKMGKASPKSDFISFQSLMKTPTPLFCKTKPKGNTPLSSTKPKFQTPKSETKKVTFGLKNNKTTEFRKTDSSLLVSPVGSSRVAFDPKKVPVSGVLKSPSPVLSVKKSAAQKRATAADFF